MSAGAPTPGGLQRLLSNFPFPYFKFKGSTSGSTTLQGPAVGGGTVTLPTGTGTLGLATGNTPVLAGATKTLTAANAGQTILLDTAAGSVVTLPAATGTGNKYSFVVKTTASSNAHKILPASVSDFMLGIVTGENAGTAKCFASDGTTNHSLQMPFAGTQPSGGFIGDWFEVQDIALGMWSVSGMYQAGTTPTTPFSTATT